MFFCVDTAFRLYEYSSGRSALLPSSVLTMSPRKKTLTFNGKKTAHHDIGLYGKRLMINGMCSCSAVHCVAYKSGVSGYIISYATEIKKNIRMQQLRALFGCNASVQQWHDDQDNRCVELQEAFALIAQKPSMIVRVLLSSVEKSGSMTWKFNSPQGFLVSAVREQEHVVEKKVLCKKSVTVSSVKGQLLCNGKKINQGLRLQPVCGYGECDGVLYDGDFFITEYKGSLLCINHVDLEEYVGAVLKTESWPGWPLEVNKVFAIACRSYVAAQAFDARRLGRPFHVKNSNIHQTYRGKHDVAVLKMAVEQTRSIVLGFNQRPILAMFDCCCGGVIPAHIDDFDFKKAPYLARLYACSYCNQCSLYSWMVSYSSSEFHDICKKHDQTLHTLSDVIVTQKDKAGLVTLVQLKGRNVHVDITGKKLYSLLKEVKSFHFDIAKKSGKFIFSGRGFGHHLGLCQWGAREMVRQGWDYKSILMYYYPQTQFMRLM